MNDVDVLRWARDVLKRKAETVIKGCVGKPFDSDIAIALVSAGRLSVVVDQLDSLAESFEEAGDERG